MTSTTVTFGFLSLRRSVAAAIGGAVMMFSLAVYAEPSGAAGEYLLGAGDELRIKVYEWRSSMGDVHEWKILNAEYKVGPSGTISVPLLGDIRVEGLTTEAVSSLISDRLKVKVGLTGRADTAVQIVGFRPVFILGAVNKPGEYPYRPDLTILQAVAVAGGLFRETEQGLLEIERGSVSAVGQWRAAIQQRNRLVAQIARLQSELDGKDTLTLPAELRKSTNELALAELTTEQEAIAKARRTTFQTKLAGYLALKDLSAKEESSLNARTVNTDEELTLVRNELRSISGLVKQGLATSPREFSLRQNDVEIQGRRLDLDTARWRARQTISRLDQQVTELQNDKRDELLKLRQEADAQLAEVTEKVRTQERLLSAYDVSRSYLSASDEAASRRPVYTVIRRSGQDIREEPAGELTVLKPGDTIRVAYPKPPWPEPTADSSALTGDNSVAAGDKSVGERRPPASRRASTARARRHAQPGKCFGRM